MSLLDILRAGIKTADAVTKDLQDTVTYKQATTNTGSGITEATGTPLRAVVDWKTGQTRHNGIVTNYRVELTILDVAAVSAATSGAGIKANDVFVLANGTSSPVVDAGMFIDAVTHLPVAWTVRLG